MRFYFLVLATFMVIGLVSCEKTKSPFSADAIEPSQGKVTVKVFDGNNPASNVIIEGTGPQGNIISTLSDSTGTAIFDPVPFIPGNWIFQMPNQAHRCFASDSQSLTISSGSFLQGVTFQYEVSANLSVNVLTSVSEPGILITEGTFTLSTQNDCGITWSVTVSSSGKNSNWGVASCSNLTPGESCVFNMVSGQSVPWILTTSSGGSINLTSSISSVIGQASNFPVTF
jgi:hypothetical protein